MSTQKTVYDELEKVNEKADPWATEHPYNKKTFEDLLALIKLVPHASILEIGCAQGAFTKRLLEISDDVTGIDVSESAINQAKQRAPKAKFEVSTLEDFNPQKQYDVIIGAEVLYYIKDRKKAIEKLQKLGKYLVTSQFVFCLPRFCLGTLQYEWDLRKFETIKSQIATYPNPVTLTIRTVRKLHS